MVEAQLANLVRAASGGSCEAYSVDFPSRPTLDEVRYAFEGYGLRWNPIVESDAIRVLNDDQPEFFGDWMEFAEQALGELAITPPPLPAGGMRHISEVCEDVLRSWAIARDERERYGVPVSAFLDNGWACPTEQSAFYRTDAWRCCSAAQRYVWNYQCRRCDVRGAGLHVHHLMPIMSGYSPYFRLNFADWKLTLYCEDCHRAYHARAVRGHGSHEYDIVDEDAARKDKAWIRQAWKVVHELGRCRYCARHQPPA